MFRDIIVAIQRLWRKIRKLIIMRPSKICKITFTMVTAQFQILNIIFTPVFNTMPEQLKTLHSWLEPSSKVFTDNPILRSGNVRGIKKCTFKGQIEIVIEYYL